MIVNCDPTKVKRRLPIEEQTLKVFETFRVCSYSHFAFLHFQRKLPTIALAYLPGTHHAASIPQPPPLCSHEAFMQAGWANQAQVWAMRGDESCETWHQANAPDTIWQCADARVVVHNHITTPFFIRADLQDSNVMGNYLDADLITRQEYGQKVHDQLLNLPNLDAFALEGSAHASPGCP